MAALSRTACLSVYSKCLGFCSSGCLCQGHSFLAGDLCLQKACCSQSRGCLDLETFFAESG